MGKYGKKTSGRVLDNQTWDGFPTVESTMSSSVREHDLERVRWNEAEVNNLDCGIDFILEGTISYDDLVIVNPESSLRNCLPKMIRMRPFHVDEIALAVEVERLRASHV